ncbi:MAG TPA: hypothetical protein VG738_00735 [Chitinophagaceae bacterium]|nr:hypothetical protein [Chitinophagaceae bacterium]
MKHILYPVITITATHVPGTEEAEIVIEDNGPGIPATIFKSLFGGNVAV